MTDKYCSQCGQKLPEVLPTHIVLILDRSGSMGGQENEVINSVNSFIKEQQAVEGEACVSLILFDNRIDTIYSRTNLQNFAPLTRETYYVCGTTALYDAITIGVEEFFSADSAKKEKTIFVIVTDGAENASRKTISATQMKTIIQNSRTKGAEFVFLAADENSFAQGYSIGIPLGNSFNYNNTYTVGAATMSKGMSTYRTSNLMSTSTFFADADVDKDSVLA